MEAEDTGSTHSHDLFLSKSGRKKKKTSDKKEKKRER
jgi:hypothetical protein